MIVRVLLKYVDVGVKIIRNSDGWHYNKRALKRLFIAKRKAYCLYNKVGNYLEIRRYFALRLRERKLY